MWWWSCLNAGGASGDGDAGDGDDDGDVGFRFDIVTVDRDTNDTLYRACGDRWDYIFGTTLKNSRDKWDALSCFFLCHIIMFLYWYTCI